MLLARHDDVTSDEVADFYRDFARRNSLGRFEDVLEGGRRIITFRHDLGRKESVLVGETMASMFMTCEQEVKLTIFDDACICEIWPRDTK
jgi:hypothetical protein